MPEATTPVAQECLNYEATKLREMFTKLFSSNEQDLANKLKVRAFFCLGKVEENENPSSLKIVLRSEDEVKSVLQRAHKLKGETLRLHRDLQPEDREKLKAALSELHERKANGESNLYIRDLGF
ncbi:unnamed protein product [Echinostoma caproni]|uniref:ADF-H domain-containing protein n=1 Tax=Echinostoma caproni TaxID=27848 RepID=A0A183B2E0_9TREM|nr:unnamed protein product [Echinostoma caproni]